MFWSKVKVKKILFTASFILMSLFCKADNHIHKDDIDMVLFTSSNKVILSWLMELHFKAIS